MADLGQILQQLQAGVRSAHSAVNSEAQQRQGAEALIRQELSRQQQDLQNLANALGSVKGSGGGVAGGSADDHIMYISQIPGRRVPFDLIISIPIGADVTSRQEETVTIGQDGPFVAVARKAAFQSTLQFTYTDSDDGSTATFQGRSFGRFRPIHSVEDFNDAMVINPITGIAAPGTGAAIYASPTNHSGFRTMEFDGVIKLLNEGSGWPRSNVDVPTPMWVDQNNTAFQLGALDFFERGETIKFEVTPSHVNNPPAGNVQAFAGGGVLMPTLHSQYDVHEGILDPYTSDQVLTDPVSRLPQGILFIQLHGFRIIQPPGPVRLS